MNEYTDRLLTPPEPGPAFDGIGLSPVMEALMRESEQVVARTRIGFREKIAYAAWKALHDVELDRQPAYMQWVFWVTIIGREYTARTTGAVDGMWYADFCSRRSMHGIRLLDDRDWESILTSVAAWPDLDELGPRYQRESNPEFRLP